MKLLLMNNNFLQSQHLSAHRPPELYRNRSDFSGAHGGGRSVHRSGGRQEITETIGDHLRRAIGQAQQRTHASSQNREREQVPGVPPY